MCAMMGSPGPSTPPSAASGPIAPLEPLTPLVQSPLDLEASALRAQGDQPAAAVAIDGAAQAAAEIVVEGGGAQLEDPHVLDGRRHVHWQCEEPEARASVHQWAPASEEAAHAQAQAEMRGALGGPAAERERLPGEIPTVVRVAAAGARAAAYAESAAAAADAHAAEASFAAAALHEEVESLHRDADLAASRAAIIAAAFAAAHEAVAAAEELRASAAANFDQERPTSELEAALTAALVGAADTSSDASQRRSLLRQVRARAPRGRPKFANGEPDGLIAGRRVAAAPRLPFAASEGHECGSGLVFRPGLVLSFMPNLLQAVCA